MEPVHHLPTGMCCQLSQHTNTPCLVKLQSLVSCPSRGGRNWLMNLVFLHNSLLTKNAQIPVSHAPQKPNKSRKPACCPSPLSDSTHESPTRLCICMNQKTVSVWMRATSSSHVSVLVWVFSALNIISSSNLQRKVSSKRSGEAQMGKARGVGQEILSVGHLSFPIVSRTLLGSLDPVFHFRGYTQHPCVIEEGFLSVVLNDLQKLLWWW